MSDGGTFTYVLGLRGDCRFTHLAPIAAAFHPMLMTFADADRVRGLPIHIVHGAQDWMFPPELARSAERTLAAGRRRGGLSRDRRSLAHLSARRECPYPRLVPGESRELSTIAKGGKALYGAPLGILMLEARFPRIPGDMGNATTWPFPVLYRIVQRRHARVGRAEGRRRTAAELRRGGAPSWCITAPRRITTNCGFLSLFQRELAAQVKVPVATSLAPAGAVGAGDPAARQAGRRASP